MPEQESEPAPVPASVTIKADITVTDASAVRRAAHQELDVQETGGEDVAEQRAEVDNSLTAALLTAIDPVLLLDSVPGIEVNRTVHGVTPRGPSAGPDFAALFPLADVSEDDDDSEGSLLTPWTASMLHTAGKMLGDESTADLVELGEDPVLEHDDLNIFARLPRITWKQDAVWRMRFLRAIDDLTSDLAEGNEPHPRCVAEAVALDEMITAAEGHAEIMQEDANPSDLPRQDGGGDWDMLREVLFQDRDFELLYDERFDGIENDEEARARFGMELRPQHWFRTFGWAEPRDPLRGFRHIDH